MPRVAVSCENLSSLPRPSRGTPIPAESFWKTKDRVAGEIPDVGTGLELTAIIVGSLALGGCTGTCGALMGIPGALPEPEPLLGIDEATVLFTPYQFP